jgi:hypothetical protein
MSLPVMAQDVINPAAILERIAPMVSAIAPGYDISKSATLLQKPKPILIQNSLLNAPGTPLIGTEIWQTLQAPDSETLQWIAFQIPGIDSSQIRAMPFPPIDSITRAAIQRKDNSIAFLTDIGLTTHHIFYLSKDVLKTLFAAYNINALTSDSGIARDGKNFQMQAMLLGNNKIQILYNRNKFEFKNTDYPQYPLILRRLVTFTIKGRGDMGVDGISIDAGLINAIMREVRNSDNGYLQIDTNLGSRRIPSKLISLKLAQGAKKL